MNPVNTCKYTLPILREAEVVMARNHPTLAKLNIMDLSSSEEWTGKTYSKHN